MHRDKDLEALENSETPDLNERPEEENLEWLLDLEEQDAEESLFTVEDDDFEDGELSDYEAQVAARPMTRGNEGGDDLSNLVTEEIVISSEQGNTSIYGSDGADAADDASEKEEPVMAIDFTQRDDAVRPDNVSVEEGMDILGLSDEDDMGEKPVVLKRQQNKEQVASQAPALNLEQKEVEGAQLELSQPKETVAFAENTEAVEQGKLVPGAANATEVLGAVSGIDFSPSAGELGEEPLSIDDLEEAPVPTQVASPEEQAVANESRDESDSGEGEATSVKEYVAEIPQSLDDESFDEFLMQGERFVDDEAIDDLDAELEVEQAEGELPLDTSEEVAIDYPQDFDQMGTLDREVASQIAALMPQVIEEVTLAAEKTMQVLQLDASSLRVEARIGTHASLEADYKEEGFLPIAQVINWVPESLEAIDLSAREQVYIRLADKAESERDYNDIFYAEQVVVAKSARDEEIDLGEEDAVQAAEHGAEAGAGLELALEPVTETDIGKADFEQFISGFTDKDEDTTGDLEADAGEQAAIDSGLKLDPMGEGETAYTGLDNEFQAEDELTLGDVDPDIDAALESADSVGEIGLDGARSDFLADDELVFGGVEDNLEENAEIDLEVTPEAADEAVEEAFTGFDADLLAEDETAPVDAADQGDESDLVSDDAEPEGIFAEDDELVFGSVEDDVEANVEIDTEATGDSVEEVFAGLDQDLPGEDDGALLDTDTQADELNLLSDSAELEKSDADDLVFGSVEEDLEADVEIDAGAISDDVEETFSGFGEDLLAEDEDGQVDIAVEVGASELASEETEPEDVVAGFEGDILGEDFSAEFTQEDGDVSLGTDIDSAFSALADPAIPELDLPEVCETDDLEEDAEAVEEVAAEVEPELEAEAEANAEVSDTSEDEPVTEKDMAQFVLAVGDGSDLGWCVPDHIAFSSASQGGGEIFAEFLDAFIEEGTAEIEKLEDLVTEWEKSAASEEILAEVNRRLHTVKGIAKGVGLQRFGSLVHNFETLIEAVPHSAAEDEQTYFRMINVWLDAVVRGIEYVTSERQDIASELPAVAQAAGQDAPEVSVDADSDEVAVDAGSFESRSSVDANVDAESEEQSSKFDKQLADEGAKALAAQQSVRITSEKLDHLLNLASQTQQLCVRASQTTNRSKRSTAELQGRLSSVRTHIGKIADRALLSVNARGGSSTELDALEMDQYSELQEAASILREGVEDLGDLIDLVSRQSGQAELLLKQQSSVISSISASIQSARVVPVSRLMPGLRRIVRTVSTDLGKVVTFRVLNEIGALDRDHYARLQVVLEHMVRNALDHGIESPDERMAAGKPTAGLITVDVCKSGGDYIIRLADDGRGIDPDALRESAFEKGIDVDVDSLSDEEALQLIFNKGFSTAAKLSEISGRGVGMDIVMSELAQIGGDVQIKSVVGQGTTFEVKIPSNVSVNGALMVTSGDDSYAIPLNGLVAVDQVPADEFFAAIKSKGNLGLFDIECEPAYLATLCQGIPLPERNFWEAFVPVIIAGTEDRHMAIAIDSVQEALELVVRSLGNQFSNVPGLAGAATTADGDAIVALDLNMLVQSLDDDGREQMSLEQPEHSSLLALVVDDSRTQRMVATSQLDTVGVETVTAENGLVAIDLLNGTHRLPDVVLLDVEMPVKDGIETLREIRKSQRYGHIPVIMVTSRTGAKHRALAKEAGCNAYMGKPFNFPAMVEQINVLTGHNLQVS